MEGEFGSFDGGVDSDTVIYDVDLGGENHDLMGEFPEQETEGEYESIAELTEVLEGEEKPDAGFVNLSVSGDPEQKRKGDNEAIKPDEVIPDDLFGFGTPQTSAIDDDFDFFGGSSTTDDFMVIDSSSTYDPFSFSSDPITETTAEEDIQNETVVVDIVQEVNEPQLHYQEKEETESNNQVNDVIAETKLQETQEREEDKVDVIPSDLFGSGPSAFDEFAESGFDDLGSKGDEFDFFGGSTSDVQDDFGSQEVSVGYEDPFQSTGSVSIDPFADGSISSRDAMFDPFGFDTPIEDKSTEGYYTPPVASDRVEPDPNSIRSTSTPQGISLYTPPRDSVPTFQPVGFDWGQPASDSFADVSLDSPLQSTFEESQGNELTRPPCALATFGFGGKLFVCHNNSRTIKSYSVKQITASSSHCKELSSYPGPLTSKTNKNKVLSFLKSKINRIQEDPNATPEESLLWELLIILIENHGELNPFSQNEKVVTQTIELLRRSNDEWLTGSSQQILKENFVDQYSKESLLQDIQSKLESGQQQEAFSVAMNNQLYEHALIIGSILGSAYYTEAVSKFVEDNLTESCSLRSVYKLCTQQGSQASGNFEDINQSQLAQKWKNHVSLLLSARNTNWQSTVGRIGDTLWQVHHNVIAAHFCYLIAGVKLSDAPQPNTRILLLTGDHKRTNTFVNGLSILLSEIYEYSQSLCQPKNIPIGLLSYKFILAGWLYDLGMEDHSKKYLRQIDGILKQVGVGKFDSSFVKQFHEFTERTQKKQGESSGWSLFSKVVTSIVGSEEASPTQKYHVPSPSVVQRSNPPVLEQNSVYKPPSSVQPAAPSSGLVNPMTQSAPVISTIDKPNDSVSYSDPFGFDAPVEPKATNPEVPQQSERAPSTAPVRDEPKPKPVQKEDKGNKADAKKSGIFGWFSGWIPKKGVKMDLGGSSQMWYSKKHGLWIPPGVDEDEYAASKKKSSAPPPPSASISASQPVVPIPTASSPNTNSGTPPSKPLSATQGSLIAPRSARRRQSAMPGSTGVQDHTRKFSSPMPARNANSFTVFTPTSSPDISTGYSAPSFEITGDVTIPDAIPEGDENENN